MSTLVACDLDSTLIFSRRSAGVDVASLTCVEHRDGIPAAFMTAEAAALLAEVAARAFFVPVTTRTEAQLARVGLPARVDYAIAANGGRILHHGVADASWSAHVARCMASVAAFDEARARCAALAAACAGRPHEVEQLFCFAVLATADVPAETIAAEIDWGNRSGWRVSVQGHKVYWVPDVLTKSAAVVELADRCGADVILAAGDSLLDADLFDVAQAGVRPAHGELADAGFRRPHVVATSAAGAAAGEEIVRWIAGRLQSDVVVAAQPTAPAAAQH